MTRAQARAAYSASSSSHRRYQDFFCVAPSGVRVGYASPKLLRTIAPRRRKPLAGAVVWISTTNPYYALRGVSAEATVAAARRRLRLGRPMRVGANRWYLVRAGTSSGVLEVRHGIVAEIAIAERVLTGSRRAERALLRAFA
jgi:hypothetical protein